MRRDLYICSSQYQLLNCLSIAKSNRYNAVADILILSFENGLKTKVDTKSLSQVFDKVFFYDICKVNESKKKMYMFLLHEVLKKNPYGMIYRTKYDNAYITGTEFHSKFVALKYARKGTKLHYYEDGLASYINILDEGFKHKQDTIFKVLYGNRPLDVCTDLYVYEPNLVINNSLNKPVKRIGKIAELFDGKKLASIFTEKCVPFTTKFVYLSSWFNQDEMYGEQRQYVSALKEVAPNDYCIKPHPSEFKSNSLSGDIVENCGNFELANFLYNMSNKVYISIISTACLTPSMLVGRKPYVIYLFKIFMKKFEMPGWKNVGKVIEKYSMNENMKNRVFIPESIEEYKKILYTIAFQKEEK